MTGRRIVLDGAAMKDAEHLYVALAKALGSRGQPSSLDAVIDIVFYDPGPFGALPCDVVVTGIGDRAGVRAAATELAAALANHRAWRRSEGRDDVDISLRLA
jgi:hypothetical protein